MKVFIFYSFFNSKFTNLFFFQIVAVELFEDSGIPIESLYGTKTGCYIGQYSTGILFKYFYLFFLIIFIC